MIITGNSPHPNSRLRERSPAAKDRARISPPPPTASSSPPRMDSCSRPLLRRRRILFPLFALGLLCLFLFSSSHDLLGLPPALQGLRRVSPASIAALMRPSVDEIHGLLYYVVHQNEALANDAPDPTRPLHLSAYADGDLAPTPDWPARVKHLNAEAPLIVFSKTYCGYSKRAKELLARYELVPPPKIIEVDLREDGDFIKAVLTRLTGRNTFPNVILRGKSIGGSDDIVAMHKNGHLRQLFEKAGLKVLAEHKEEDN
ncbi:thioredoxin-like protein [Multifurca ochricompacta]|uniref:Thioredoxin-like protein n=1 Tax=Multifurca ochricompacta TaxID=376703 RepID=A0AAD4LW72_9AGAM|nr:thioredoxin-like protein [Multifurca ochricompacta]